MIRNRLPFGESICTPCLQGHCHLCDDYKFSGSLYRHDVACPLCGSTVEHGHSFDEYPEKFAEYRRLGVQFGRLTEDDGVLWRPPQCRHGHTATRIGASELEFNSRMPVSPLRGVDHTQFKARSLKLPLMVRLRLWWQRRARRARAVSPR